jgi:hypothetical protein
MADLTAGTPSIDDTPGAITGFSQLCLDLVDSRNRLPGSAAASQVRPSTFSRPAKSEDEKGSLTRRSSAPPTRPRDPVIRNIDSFVSDPGATSWDLARPRREAFEATSAPEDRVHPVLISAVDHEEQAELAFSAVRTDQLGGSIRIVASPLKDL